MSRALILLAVLLVCGGAVIGRSVYEGERALAAGDAAADRGDRTAAIAAWQEAASWVAPLAPHVDAARSRLTAHRSTTPAAAGPGAAWIAVAAIGLALWIGGAAYFTRRGLDGADRLVYRDAGAAAALVTLGLVTWMVGLYLA